MNDSLENAFAQLGLSDSDSDDTITPVGEPSVPIGRSSRKHSYDPNGRLSDEEPAHYDTPRPSGRAYMYEDSDIEEEGCPPVSSTGYPRGGSDLSNSQKREVSGAQGGPYIRPAQFRASHSVHSGSGWGSVVRCSSPVGDYDFVPPRDTLRDPTSQGSYVAPAPGKSPTVQSASAALESEDHVIPPQPLPSASNVLAP